MAKKNQDTEIALIKKDILYIKEQATIYHIDIKEDIDLIKKKLLGNGKTGLCDEINQFKGALKGTQILFGIIVALITLAILIINFWKGG